VDLTWVFVVPEAVKIGDRTLLASSLRLKDMARLQAYARSQVPCPLDVRVALIDATPPGSEARRRLLRDTYNACETWPPRLGTAEGQAVFDTPVGLRVWLMVVLAEDNPDLTKADIDELAETMTISQYRRLIRIAFGSHPLDTLKKLISPESFPERPSDPANWGETIANLIAETGWTFEQCGEVRLTQLEAWRTKGQAGGSKLAPPPGMSLFKFSRRQKAFFGPDRDEPQANPEAESEVA
jgi:hypothetical protein